MRLLQVKPPPPPPKEPFLETRGRPAPVSEIDRGRTSKRQKAKKPNRGKKEKRKNKNKKEMGRTVPHQRWRLMETRVLVWEARRERAEELWGKFGERERSFCLGQGQRLRGKDWRDISMRKLEHRDPHSIMVSSIKFTQIR